MLQIIQILSILWIQFYHLADCHPFPKVTFTNLNGVEETAEYTNYFTPAKCDIEKKDTYNKAYKPQYFDFGFTNKDKEFESCIPRRKKNFQSKKTYKQILQLCEKEAITVVVYVNNEGHLVCCKKIQPNLTTYKGVVPVPELTKTFTNSDGKTETAIYTEVMPKARCYMPHPKVSDIGYFREDGLFQSCKPSKRKMFHSLSLTTGEILHECEKEASNTRIYLNDDSVVYCEQINAKQNPKSQKFKSSSISLVPGTSKKTKM